MQPIEGTTSANHKFVTDTGISIERYRQGFQGWLSHVFRKSVWIDVRDREHKKNLRLYVPLTEVWRIIIERYEMVPSKRKEERLGNFFVRALKRSPSKVFEQRHSVPSTNLEATVSPKPDYSTTTKIQDKQRSEDQAVLEFVTLTTLNTMIST